MTNNIMAIQAVLEYLAETCINWNNSKDCSLLGYKNQILSAKTTISVWQHFIVRVNDCYVIYADRCLLVFLHTMSQLSERVNKHKCMNLLLYSFITINFVRGQGRSPYDDEGTQSVCSSLNRLYCLRFSWYGNEINVFKILSSCLKIKTFITVMTLNILKEI